ncbi:DASS family sodium-coupled anion symporter [Corynebacterium sp. TAE3-ERU12]|uniref:SLC13 family permease n=1 Tax=Corynebacterium sp. TAE3-ERU12 TaxID=2849491 RepID=UPI001C46B18F|nr:DASS family sodium-coupled anion symporter [Corynebacterium sp. TAE3-ERU12]MBV7295320.1 DASS family sodium-coupled anion symporter [Corynebacterium sp. TAE3-ERU12]
MSVQTSSRNGQHLSEGQKDRGRAPRALFRERSGLIIGVVLAFVVYYVMPSDLSYQLRATAAATVLIAVWWMSEAIPIAATALVPLVLFPALGLSDIGDFSGSYTNPTIFLFMGGFMLALAMQRWNLHKRIALWVLSFMASSSQMLILGFMLATGFLSMWVSNTATAVMMLPIGVSVLAKVVDIVREGKKHDSSSTTDSAAQDIAEDAEEDSAPNSNFGIALMLGIAYSASIGSLGTIIGTPPNAMLVAYMSENHDLEIGFGRWMLVGVPVAMVLMLVAWVLLTFVFYKPEINKMPGGREMMKAQLKDLGPMSTGEKRVLIAFIAAALAWVFVPVLWKETLFSDAVIAMTVGIALFIIPGGRSGVKLLTWRNMNELPWGVLLLFGGGLALSTQFTKSGLSEWIGEQMEGLGGLPVLFIIGGMVLVVLLLTEFTSNTATAATFLPIVGGIALTLGVDPMVFCVPVALAATSAFVMPVATPPNAIAYGSGYVTMQSMIKVGMWLNLIAMVLISITSVTLLGWVFNLVY